jgi:hypothetical protein
LERSRFGSRTALGETVEDRPGHSIARRRHSIRDAQQRLGNLGSCAASRRLNASMTTASFTIVEFVMFAK